MKTGTIYTVVKKPRFALICRVVGKRLTHYFMPVKKVLPKVGSKVSFEVKNRSPKEGGLDSAVNVRVL